MERRTIRVRGIVQGVGFRPYVFGLASRLALQGFVRNETGAVLIDVEGERKSLDCFLDELERRPPPLARIQDLVCERHDPLGRTEFCIERSDGHAGGEIMISPDVATCDACLAELFDARDRRYEYPFINCTNCGPRLTIVTGAPYDRARTTMVGFVMCEACRVEYEDPRDRRFHAQPIACAACGPRLRLLDAAGCAMTGSEPLAGFVDVIRSGGTGALKGLGGYHLVCDATNEAAVDRLRARKHREEKPLAVMLPDAVAVETLCELNAAERALLESAGRPIVLLRRRETSGHERAMPRLAESVAPGNPCLGVMLPYTPLHHLLLARVAGLPLVMTSGNRSDEPIAYRDESVVGQLQGIADCFLTHDRPIHVRCDDSVARVVGGAPLVIRRSRGQAPAPIDLPMESPVPVLAVGGQLKATFALACGRHAIVGHHLGDLDHYEAYCAFERDVKLYEELFAVSPMAIAHDLHPDYASTRYSRQRAANEGVELIPVQHHHAHLASCLVDNGLAGPAIGVTFDGTGYGTDGAVWGGEFLIGGFDGFQRAAQLRYVGMPGGEQAIREPWRMAVAHARDAGCDLMKLDGRFDRTSVRQVEQMLAREFNSPPTSSMGRLFDAVAAIVGIRHKVSYEGQAAVELEWLATEASEAGQYSYALDPPDMDIVPPRAMTIDTRPLIREIIADVQAGIPRARIARKFHGTIVQIVADVCCRLRDQTGMNLVALSGGVFLNALLSREVFERLVQAGFQVCTHRQVSPGDGGLSLGQLAIAASVLNRRSSTVPSAVTVPLAVAVQPTVPTPGDR
jgi:hydrogenase maturation protein HypF